MHWGSNSLFYSVFNPQPLPFCFFWQNISTILVPLASQKRFTCLKIHLTPGSHTDSTTNKTCNLRYIWDLQRAFMNQTGYGRSPTKSGQYGFSQDRWWIWSHTLLMAFALHTDNSERLNFSPVKARTIRAKPQRANGSLASYVSL